MLKRIGLITLLLMFIFGASCWAAPILGIYIAKSEVSILQVSPGSPAEKYGLKAGDKIIRINDEQITSYKLFSDILNAIPGYNFYTMTVIRNGQEITLQVQKEEYSMKPYDHTKQTIGVPEGNFSFTDLDIRIPNNGGDPWLAGKVTNNTDKNWSDISFKAIFYNNEDKVVGEKVFSIYNFNIGKQYQFGNNDFGEIIYGVKNMKFSRIELVFLRGIYPVIYNCSIVKPDIGNSLLYSDENISIQYKIVTDAITFQLTNKTNNPIKVDWNQISFIDPTGLAQKIMHTGVKYNNANEYQQPTIIPPMARIEDQLVPTKNIWFEEGKYGGWQTNPLFPEGPTADKLIGQTFGVFLPLEINGQTVNHNFTFKIESITK